VRIHKYVYSQIFKYISINQDYTTGSEIDYEVICLISPRNISSNDRVKFFFPIVESRCHGYSYLPFFFNWRGILKDLGRPSEIISDSGTDKVVAFSVEYAIASSGAYYILKELGLLSKIIFDFGTDKVVVFATVAYATASSGA
jgi:hypothetical protein